MTTLLAPRDAAKLLGIGTARIQQLDREVRLKALRDSAGRRLFTREAVEAFLRGREQRQRACYVAQKRLA
jgi:excisionase family DNA binding protein